MGLPFKLETLDSIDETHRELYKPHDEGGFQLNVEGLDQHIEQTNRGLVKALAAERAENKGFKALGKRPDEIVAALARATEHKIPRRANPDVASASRPGPSNGQRSIKKSPRPRRRNARPLPTHSWRRL